MAAWVPPCASERLAAGDLAARTGLSPASDEFGLLAKSFDAMALALRVAHILLMADPRGRDSHAKASTTRAVTLLAPLVCQVSSADKWTVLSGCRRWKGGRV